MYCSTCTCIFELEGTCKVILNIYNLVKCLRFLVLAFIFNRYVLTEWYYDVQVIYYRSLGNASAHMHADDPFKKLLQVARQILNASILNIKLTVIKSFILAFINNNKILKKEQIALELEYLMYIYLKIT